MATRTQLLLSCLLLVGGAAACGGQASTGDPTGACAGVAPPVLLYPAPSSTGQPDGNLDIWVGYPNNPTPPFSGPTLIASGQQAVTGPTWLPPSPGPTNPPGMTPLPPGDMPFISGIPALASATTYRVQVTNAACNQTFTLGSFTTM